MLDTLNAGKEVRPPDGRVQAVMKQFGYKALSPEQAQLIEASIAGRDIFGVMPTGSGKSACYQIPGIVTRARTLVISPLIALLEDQVRSLRRVGVKAFAYHSGMTEASKKAVEAYFVSSPRGEASFLYISPELLLTEKFRKRFVGVVFDRIAVDEAHCVSTWGSGFRPDYQRIRLAATRMRIPHCAAFTATVDTKIEADIQKRIPLRSDFLKVEADPMRPNLLLSIEEPSGDGDSNSLYGRKKFARLQELISAPEYAGPAIVYCSSKDGAASLYVRLRAMRGLMKRYEYTPYLFHAGLPQDDKYEALRGFKEDKRPLIFATSAFGMGVDRRDIRQIIHYNTPFTLIDYAQQIGRGGRDGAACLCTTFISRSDYHDRALERLVWESPEYDFVERVLNNLRRCLDRLDKEVRSRYNLRSFILRMQAVIERNERIKHKERYMRRVRTSIGMLRELDLIHEDSDGLAVFNIVPGGEHHKALLEKTQMHERMLIREAERIGGFFESPVADQQLLWDILRRP